MSAARPLFVLGALGSLRSCAALALHAAGQPVLSSGDSVFFWGPSGAYMSIEDYNVYAHHTDARGAAGVFVQKKEGGEISSGDTVFLHSPGGFYVDVEENGVKARWADPGDWQALKIHGPREGPIHHRDLVSFVAHNGNVLVVDHGNVTAQSPSSTASLFQVDRPEFGALHDVVGKDGVLMISAEDGRVPRNRTRRSLDALKNAGIYPAIIRATSGLTANPIQLQLSCPLDEQPGTDSWCAEMGRAGLSGCTSVVEQAITDSHRRALIAASKRSGTASDWTAIIEDDAVPVQPENFNKAFRQAWANVPHDTKLVRLGWCTFEDNLGEIKDKAESEHAGIRLVRERWWTDSGGADHYYTGGCATGYLVHRSFIHEMLQIFPCCCGIDCCLQHQLFYAPAADGVNTPGRFRRWRGSQIMVDMDHVQSRDFSIGFAAFNQSGILVQDERSGSDK